MSLKAALLVTLTLASGCSLFGRGGPSDVARGEYYAAGKPEFDSFFIALHEQQVQLLQAPEEPAAARKNLTETVGLAADADDESLKARLAQELKKLASQGLRLRLDVPAPSAAVDASATLYSSDASTATPLRAALPQEATRLTRSRNRMLQSKAALEKLNIMGISLDGRIDESFRVDGPWKRSEVRKNLADGQKLITLMRARSQEIATLDQQLLSLLSEVASTDSSLGKTHTPPPPADDDDATPTARAPGGKAAPANRPAPAGKPASAAKPSAAPAALPKPAPSPKSTPKRGGDDEAAAPKPTQGNAPAEIEP